MLREKFAQKFNLPLERVAIRDFSSLKNILYSGKKTERAGMYNPDGYRSLILEKEILRFSYVTVNGKVIRLLETEPVNIGRVLIVAGYSPVP